MADLFASSSDDDDGEAPPPPPPRPDENGVLAFHTGVEEQMLLHVARSPGTKGDAAATLRAVDAFCYARHWMMHVGDIKGAVLRGALAAAAAAAAALGDGCPVRAVELGAYCGYSGVLLAAAMAAVTLPVH